MAMITGACLDPMGIDTACLSIVNHGGPVQVYSVFDECYMCYGLPFANLSEGSNTTFQISTKYPSRLYILENISNCNSTYSFKEHGHYGWNITKNNCSNIYEILEPSNSNLPLLAALMVYILVLVVMGTSKLIINTLKLFLRHQPTGSQDDLSRLQESEGTPQLISVSKTGMRMQALDAFRGIAVLLMIFVNNGGGHYVFLNHSPWNGLTVADLVLPWFAWAMGFSIVSSIRVQLRVSISRLKLISKQMRRTVVLLIFGLMINSISKACHSNETLSHLRFPGILQLLAISYLIASTVEACFTNAQRNFHSERFCILVCIPDILERWIQWLVFIAIIVLHTSITFLLPVPGCPRGYLGPGGYQHYGDYKNCTAGAAGYIDRLVFGSHIYNKTANAVYGTTLPHDPEGIMNTLSATLIVFLGVQAGHIFVTYYQAKGRIIRWQLWFLITGIAAGLLCNFSKENGIIPINKNMMSLSFVLCTSSLAFLLFSLLYYTIDYKKYWRGSPFIYAGANPILLYVGHYLTMGLFPFDLNFISEHNITHAIALAKNLWTTGVWALVAYGLYRKEILLSV